MNNPTFRRISIPFLAIGLTLAATASLAQTPQPKSAEWKRPTYQIGRAEKPPVIDGKLDDECWKSALHAPSFHRFRSEAPVTEQTEAWITADKTHLYVAFRCFDTKPELIRAHETQRDGKFDQDDFVVVAIDSQGSRRGISEFNVNARGTQSTKLDGGTADNLTWSGDWTAATQRTSEGWTVEIAIPFSLLKYSKGAKSFPIAILRQMSRETNPHIWPYMPPAGFNNPMPYICDFAGFEPPYFPPRLVFLPYTLATLGQKSTLKMGMDVKYPVSTTMTGLATIFPDFATVEQAVQDLSFSYTERYLPDRRPFFAEGSQFDPDPFLFYSQRIPRVDGGLKLVGKNGPTTISMLGTTAREGDGQSAFVASVGQDLGTYSNIGATVLGNNTGGQPANRVAQVGGRYGWAKGSRTFTVSGNMTKSWLAGAKSDNSDFIRFATEDRRGRLNGYAFYTTTGPDFVNQLGLVDEVNVKGGGLNLYRNDAFDKGAIERTYFELAGNSFRHATGGFFHDAIFANGYVGMRNGWEFNFGADMGRREDFKDHSVGAGVGWNQKTLFQRGNAYLQQGRRQNQTYQFISLNQGVLVSKGFSLNLGYNQSRLGSDRNSQTVASGTYRLNPQETFGGRLVSEDGKSNLYLSYGRRMRHGTDVFILIGDPNSSTTKGVVTIKLVRPF